MGFMNGRRARRAGKSPTMRDGSPFAFAGIWEVNAGGNGHPVPGFVIITTTPNAVVEPIHTRIPVMLRPEQKSVNRPFGNC
jgi:putative SOS response-associated peptidase YedK